MKDKSQQIWVAGYPSLYGGADTELDHNIDLWLSHGLDVHLVPMSLGLNDITESRVSKSMKAACDKRGCKTHKFHKEIFKDKIVVSFCNGVFLRELKEIIKAGRPALVIWFNCMTNAFDKEVEAHKNGWIDIFGFVSDYQRKQLKPVLEEFGPVEELDGYIPYFNIKNCNQKITHSLDRPEKYFGAGRVSRDDANKYPEDMWDTFASINTPVPLKTFILGYGDMAKSKVGSPPLNMDCTVYPPQGIATAKFYKKIHVLIHKTGGSRESYGRIIPECYAAGVIPIVEDDFAFPEIVTDKVTGFRCKSSKQMSEKASLLASNKKLRKEMVKNGYKFLQENMGNSEKCWDAWRAIFEGNDNHYAIEINELTGIQEYKIVGEFTPNKDYLYSKECPPRVGLVIGTFGSVPYIHLGLESWKRNFPDVPVLVHDDCSLRHNDLKTLCQKYGVTFETNSCRFGHTHGDLSAFYGGLNWAKWNEFDLMVKFSRRFIPLYDWTKGLLSLAQETQSPTFSNICEFNRFQFRTECIGMHVDTWIKAGALQNIKEQLLHGDPDSFFCVESHLWEIAKALPFRKATRDYFDIMDPLNRRFALWNIMSNSRLKMTQDVLWWNANNAEEYYKKSKEWGLPYAIKDFRIINN